MLGNRGVPGLSVVIPTYQRCASLEMLLHALVRQTLPPAAFEVIVIVDGSADGTADMLSRFTAPFSLRWMAQPNRGRAAACNAGVALAARELIVLLDDDMEPVEGFLAAHAAQHPEGSRRAVMGAAPIVMTPTAPANVRYVGDKFNRHVAKLAAPGYQFALRDFYSGNLSIRRDLLVLAGGFDEDFTVYGNEDLELSVRLRRKGIDIAFCQSALAHQHYSKNFAELARDNVHKGRTAVLLASKHPQISDELTLATWGRGSALRRVVLGGLVNLSLRWPATFDGVVAGMSALGRLTPPGLDRAYATTLDYCYFLGAQRAAREGTGSPRP